MTIAVDWDVKITHYATSQRCYALKSILLVFLYRILDSFVGLMQLQVDIVLNIEELPDIDSLKC